MHHKPNFLVAYSTRTISFLDITTGDAFYYEISDSSQKDHLMSLLSPVEILLSKEQKDQNHYKDQNITCTVHESSSSSGISPTGIPSNDRLLSYVVGMQGQKVLSTIKPFEKRLFFTKDENIFFNKRALRAFCYL